MLELIRIGGCHCCYRRVLDRLIIIVLDILTEECTTTIGTGITTPWMIYWIGNPGCCIIRAAAFTSAIKEFRRP